MAIAIPFSLISNYSYALPVGSSSFSGYSQTVVNEFNVAAPDITRSSQVSLTGDNISKTTRVGTATAFSRTSLISGTLKSSSKVIGYEPLGLRALKGASAVSSAMFGDSFSHTTGNNQVFSFSNNQTASFSFNVDGFSNKSTGDNGTEAAAYLNIFILEKGSLAKNTSENGGIIISDANFQATLHNDLIAFGSYGLTPTSTTTENYRATGDLNSPVADNPFALVPVDGFLSDGDILDFVFNPGGDFDWTIQLVTVAAVSEGLGAPLIGTQSAIADFSNTISVDYFAPTGVNTTSASGLFPNTSPAVVPLPATVWLFISGLAGLIGFRNKRC